MDTGLLLPIEPVTWVIAGRPLPFRRRVEGLSIHVSTRLGRDPVACLRMIFERVLRLPGRAADHLNRRAAKLDVISEIKRIALPLQLRRGVLHDFEAAVIADEAESLLRHLAVGERPLMLTSIGAMQGRG